MKMNNIKLYALLVAVLFVGACSDELEQGYGPVKIACDEEIQFGVVSGAVNDAKGTRTVYGDVNGDKDKIEVNWVDGDRLSIASPQAGGVADHVATYVVGGIQEGYEHKANSLVKVGDVALQWTDSEEYDFYAVYPSVVADKVEIELENGNAYLKGCLPVSQSGTVEKDEETGNITIVPDMHNAFMTAKQYYNIKDENGNPRTDPVQLTFNSLCTAVQFELSAGELVEIGENASFDKTVKILSVTLSSAKRRTICGDFTYNYADGTVESSGNGNNDLSYVTIDFSDEVLLTFGKPEKHTDTHNNIADTHYLYQGSNSVNFTFFMLPEYKQSVDEGDLHLKIVFTVDGVTQTKIATVNSDIKASTKHFFGGMKLPMPTLGSSEDANTSNWFSILNNDIYISQLSFVVAGNAFSNNSADEYKEQVHDYETLWNLGVRGFEICTYNINDDIQSSIANAPIISGGAKVGSYTVSGVFENLYSKLGDETLVLVFTGRHAKDLGYFNPNVFVNQITNYLDEFLVKVNNNETDTTKWTTKRKHLFARLGSKSCVGDLKGKIAIIVRPGDNDYITAFNNTNKTEIPQAEKAIVAQNWADYITVIDDWGTAEDQWGDRYGNFYDAEAYSAAGGKSVFETKFLPYEAGYALTSIIGWRYATGGNFPDKVEAKDKNYGRMVNNDTTDIAYVQCWERVVHANDDDFRQVYYKEPAWNKDGSSLKIKWFESYSEKKEVAEEILNRAMGHKGEEYSPLYINSLCGFFIHDDMKMSYQPLLRGSADFGGRTIHTSEQKTGTGGDFKSCAANLNYWMYNELKTSTTEGPYGVVMLDYIGATETQLNGFTNVESISAADAAKACQELPIMIMMNNFKFPMVTNPNYGIDNTMEKVELSQQPLDQGKDFLRWIEE